ncbi:hypothetical protein HOY82DRAFT_627508 [Tuber indicum]|nr:hypothetical protein HOY82DRAFT_627508 [Tuber indicum]
MEADTGFKPLSTRPGKGNWPTLVIECGVSKTMERLQVDANWWLTNSSGNVNVVLLLAITEASKNITIEKWEDVPAENSTTTRYHPEDVVEIPTSASSRLVYPRRGQDDGRRQCLVFGRTGRGDGSLTALVLGSLFWI